MNGRPRCSSAPRALVAALVSLAMLLGPMAAAAPAAGAPSVSVPHRYQVPQLRAHEQFDPLRPEEAWRHATGAGVVVAVLDSGVDADHPDLAGRVLPGADFVDGSTDGRVDPVGHGTTVASLVAAAGEPAVGIAPEATILPVRVLDEQNRYQRASTVAEGVIWAVDNGADIINLSLGGPRFSDSLAEALAYAMANDVVVVACTGNDTGEGVTEVWYPAREPGVVAVAGVTFSDGSARNWSASLTGPETVLAAPAVVVGAAAGGGYRQVQGTSFASAVVAGTAALIRSRWPQLSAGDVVNRLITTADQPGEPNRNQEYGFGVVDPVGALTEPVPDVPINPLDTKARQADGAVGLGPAPENGHRSNPLAVPTPHEFENPADQLGGEVARAPAPTRSVPSAPTWLLLAGLFVGLAAVASRYARRYRS